MHGEGPARPGRGRQTGPCPARDLLEQFGVEDTAVLRADGTLSARSAAESDQQLVHQHAVALGLPVAEPSPMDRWAQAAALRQQARDLLAPP